MEKKFLLFDSRADSYPRVEDSVRNTAIPSVCTVPLRVSDKEFTPVVEVGDRVEEGGVIAKYEMRKHSLYLYSPIPGIISSIKSTPIGSSSSDQVPTIQIKLEGSFSILGKTLKRKTLGSLSVQEMRSRLLSNDSNNIAASLFAKNNNEGNILLVQISDPEPYMSNDRQVFHLYTQQVMEGMIIAERLLSPDETVIICPSSCKKLIAKFLPKEDGDKRHVYYFDLFKDYIQITNYGLSQILKKHYNDGNMGIRAVLTASVLHILYETVTTASPVFERIISIGGEGVVKPLHLKVRIGTSVGSVLRVCGGINAQKNPFVLIGGPFTGTKVERSTVPIGIDTTTILALSEKQAHRTKQSPCIQCGACSQICPAELHPRMLVKMIENNKQALAIQNGLYDCIECGLCTYVCPSRIQLFRQILLGKGGVK